MQHSSYQLLTVPFESKRRYQGEGMHINTVFILCKKDRPQNKIVKIRHLLGGKV